MEDFGVAATAFSGTGKPRPRLKSEILSLLVKIEIGSKNNSEKENTFSRYDLYKSSL